MVLPLLDVVAIGRARGEAVAARAERGTLVGEGRVEDGVCAGVDAVLQFKSPET